MKKLVFGCGYLGARVAVRWLQQGENVFAVTRSLSNARHLADRGLQPIVADVTKPRSLAALPEVDTVLYAVGFDKRSGATMEQVYVAGFANALAALSSATQRLVYISSTGVYGQSDGVWVTEQSACEPKRYGGKICLAAEQTLRDHPLGRRAVILRLAGIYGPGRVPRRAKLRNNETTLVPTGFLNLIHVDDAVQTVLAAEKHIASNIQLPRVYNVSDGHPVERLDYYRDLARLLGLDSVTLGEAQPGTTAAGRGLGNKRVSSQRIREELAIAPRYATYREGLAAIIAGGG